MKKLLLIRILITLFTAYTAAQCGINEVEIRVEITTDPYLLSTVVMRGVQGGDGISLISLLNSLLQ